MQTFLLKYSRDAENEADTLGVGYATRSGYAAGESSRFFQALQRISAAGGKNCRRGNRRTPTRVTARNT